MLINILPTLINVLIAVGVLAAGYFVLQRCFSKPRLIKCANCEAEMIGRLATPYRGRLLCRRCFSIAND